MADGSLGTYSSGMTFSYADQTLPGHKYSRGTIMPTAITRDLVPSSFPLDMWNDQQNRYSQWWKWWRGDPFNEIVEEGTDTQPPIYRYPLRINTLRQICRIHNAMLWGKQRKADGTLISTRVLPPPDFAGDKGKRVEALRPVANFAERLIRYVWTNSNQSALLWEAGLISQFLGGYYLQLQNLTGLRQSAIPLGVKLLYPDFVLPIPNPDDPYELLEAFVTYRISSQVAAARYGIDTKKTGNFAIYTQHWQGDVVSEFVNGQPFKKSIPGVLGSKIVKESVNQPNPFGMVPIFYVPRLRSGAFMGDPITPEIVGLLAEYNARYGDIGDMVDQSAQIMWQLTNSTTPPVNDKMQDGTPYVDLGQRQPGPYSENPTLEPKRPEQVTEATAKYPQQLRTDIMRESMTSPVTLGDDPGGGQRSGETLLIRMFPTMAMADASRSFADPALRRIELLMLLAVSRLGINVPGVAKIEESDVYSLDITHVWNPSIPRDEEKDAQRRVAEVGAGTMSTRRALEQQPEVEDVDEELRLIREDQEVKSKLSTPPQAPGDKDEKAPAPGKSTAPDADAADDAPEGEGSE